jgi:hypothetical protein
MSLNSQMPPSSQASKPDDTLACMVRQMVEDDKVSDLGRLKITSDLKGD